MALAVVEAQASDKRVRWGIHIRPDHPVGAGQGAAPGTEPSKHLSLEAAISLAIIVMMNSPQNRYTFLVELEWMLFPAIVAGQFKIYMNGTKPVAFAAWAKVSEEVEKRLEKGAKRLAPEDWTSGNKVRLVHLIAPFGGEHRIIDDLGSTVLAGHKIKLPRNSNQEQSLQDIAWESER